MMLIVQIYTAGITYRMAFMFADSARSGAALHWGSTAEFTATFQLHWGELVTYAPGLVPQAFSLKAIIIDL